MVIELERLVASDSVGKARAVLADLMAELGLTPTSKEELNRRVAADRADWQRLMSMGDER